MSSAQHLRNREVYERAAVAEDYAKRSGLFSSEEELFSRHFRLGARILDLGVGGGRTTPFLSTGASRYLAADCSESMVRAFAARFPGKEVLRFDAADEAEWERRVPEAGFDVIVFSFNGIDYLHPRGKIEACLRACRRALAPGGVLIFSSHHSRVLGVWPEFEGAGPIRGIWRLVRSLVLTPFRAARTLRTAAFWKGEGYVIDPTHGGLETFVSRPRCIRSMAEGQGFELVEALGSGAPAWATPWYYYVLRAAGEQR